MAVRIQTADFDVGAELTQLRGSDAKVGAIASFIGLVRDINDANAVHTLTLEHYPEMTEKSLTGIAQQAQARWDIIDSLIIHRVGRLQPLDQIVLVAVTSAHRQAAFQACEFIMDYLKTQAPFWKKELTDAGDRWVEAKDSDDAAQQRWQT